MVRKSILVKGEGLSKGAQIGFLCSISCTELLSQDIPLIPKIVPPLAMQSLLSFLHPSCITHTCIKV